MNRAEMGAYLRGLRFNQESNVKFYRLLWSRLIEEGIVAEDATKICGVLEYDFSNIPEDNDSLTEFASEYADYAIKVYTNIKKMNGIKDITPLLKYFNVGKLEISSL